MVLQSDIVYWRMREAEERLAIGRCDSVKGANAHRVMAARYADWIRNAEEAALRATPIAATQPADRSPDTVLVSFIDALTHVYGDRAMSVVRRQADSAAGDAGTVWTKIGHLVSDRKLPERS